MFYNSKTNSFLLFHPLNSRNTIYISFKRSRNKEDFQRNKDFKLYSAKSFDKLKQEVFQIKQFLNRTYKVLVISQEQEADLQIEIGQIGRAC